MVCGLAEHGGSHGMAEVESFAIKRNCLVEGTHLSET